jgi:transposase-like protein
VVRFGQFKRKGSRKLIQRYLCRCCHKTFSQATVELEFRQKKRKINQPLFQLLVSNVSMRRAARLIQIDQKTVARRFTYFSAVSRRRHEEFLSTRPTSKEVQFDDMETSEHTKLKPLSIPLMVDKATREVLSFDVVRMPAKGKIAAVSRKKYGYRRDCRKKGWETILTEARKTLGRGCVVTTDSHKMYPIMIKKHLPDDIVHVQTISRRASVAGQGEMKMGGYDPLFALNHTAAMLRANINRLIRRTWCTTKRPDRLKCHIAMYVYWHNETIAAELEKRKPSFQF